MDPQPITITGTVRCPKCKTPQAIDTTQKLDASAVLTCSRCGGVNQLLRWIDIDTVTLGGLRRVQEIEP